MTFSPSKSTIFVPKNLRNSPKVCVDCNANDANYYSYAYKVYLCVECAKIHDAYLGKYDLDAQRRYHCPLLRAEVGHDENYHFNREFEEFLPEFFQKMGTRTPQNFRKEYIISKYSHKIFTTQTGIDSLIPDFIITLILKRCKQRATWHPCCIKVDRRDKTLRYYSYKANKLDPKLVIPLENVDLFMEPLEDDTYLQLIWTKDLLIRNQKKSFIKRKISSTGLEPISNQVRNFYFRPSTDFELLQLYFSICVSKSHLYLPPVPLYNTLKRSFSCDLILSREEDEMIVPFLPTRKSVCDFLTERLDFIIPKQDPGPDPLICGIFDSPREEQSSQTLPDRLALKLSGSYCMDTREREFFSSCHDINYPISQEEVDTNFRTDRFDCVIDTNFYSCTPGEQTNPFLPPKNIFQDNSDNCAIFDTSPLLPLSPAIWTPPPVDNCPIDLDVGVGGTHLYDSIRRDVAGNKKLYQMSGWLYKAGEMAGDKWRYRWFNLSNTRVTYSDTKFAPFPKNHFQLDSHIKGFSVDTLPSVVNLIHPPNAYSFRILTPHRVYHLCATSEEDRATWMEIVSRVIALSFVLK